MNNFTRYTSREAKIMNEWVDATPWLKEIVDRVEKDNTPLHDAKLILKNGEVYTVEIKEEEDYWYSRTGNFGFDYISVFYFNSEKAKQVWLGDGRDNKKYWIKRDKLSTFKNYIKVNKYGKLVTCDADIQLHAVYDKETDNLKLVKAYNSNLLTSGDFVEYVQNSYDLRINKKNNYGLNDDWESAAYMINPLYDKKLISCEIINKEQLFNIHK